MSSKSAYIVCENVTFAISEKNAKNCELRVFHSMFKSPLFSYLCMYYTSQCSKSKVGVGDYCSTTWGITIFKSKFVSKWKDLYKRFVIKL